MRRNQRRLPKQLEPDLTHQRASDEEWVGDLGDRAWIAWARAVVQQDPEKIAMIKAVTLMLGGLMRRNQREQFEPDLIHPRASNAV
jgi:hypothetical protein